MTQLWTCENLADHLNCSVNKIYKDVKKNIIPYTKIGGAIRFNPVIIDKWINQNTIVPDKYNFSI
jgi:excisionase family DNA binding protein